MTYGTDNVKIPASESKKTQLFLKTNSARIISTETSDRSNNVQKQNAPSSLEPLPQTK